ncbi:MAG: helix-turn-helix transcriptional regulator [Gammaproteobacteria bacterium]|jgi:DNA-binding XRE family transcriptional regulator|uniref:helix-turn-helix domain-containing protein n=1 Tax=Stutzerimonas xanthomarina TaxID=271420 RepID=UPI000E89DA97|nr:helix-turn-helix transcriptional regulator [Stutzerimonas xanthomarina]MBU0813069.1 helix-turn-helix transcriptional regulator [Gammaproteobacteria bacterium]HAW24902.1 transcriptional regulator [Pseudomonas sp.]MBK3848504.1 helix-turn-helix domain-containing protein [Stutzerimonas xanthomarina]MBU0851820.1 helix-turn-helix transcriptional regulator [Gammaproteobacteria bacterium]MBU1302352.1 helix-turn-helix transcriptional regulator [Gammaproteobacteria bacterium]|tara:strand:+ start:33072 stop:33398 length:327 start_codon:yes stop_codon:yes gene_type:complete
MSVQVIMRDGMPEYAVLPWDEYQALLGSGRSVSAAVPVGAGTSGVLPKFNTLPVLREAKGLTQEALARSVGISPAYLDLIERGEREPGEAIRRALARALEIEGWQQEA